jgi:hypothetical protein
MLILAFWLGIANAQSFSIGKDSASFITDSVHYSYGVPVKNTDDSSRATFYSGKNRASLDSMLSIFLPDTTGAKALFAFKLLNGAPLSPGTWYYYKLIVWNPGMGASLIHIPANVAPWTDSMLTASLVPTITSLPISSKLAGSGTFTVTVVGTNFVPASQLTWNGANRTLVSVNATGDTLKGVITSGDLFTAGTYSIGVTNPPPGGGSSNTMNFTVACPTVSVTASAPSSICIGQSKTLTASGASTYVWSSGQSASSAVVSPTSTATYTVVGTDIHGCTGSSTVSVTVNPLPNIAIASNSTICSGSSATLTASGGSSYLWSNAQTAVSITVAPTSTQSYSVTGTDLNGCANTANASVNVNPLPIVSAASNSTVCLGNSATLTASGAVSYVWSSGQSTVSITASPTSTSAYSVVGTDANGCINTATVSVNVNPLPVAVANASPASICFGSNATLNAGGGTSYLWSTGSTGSTGSSIVVSPTASSIYTVTATNAFGCTATSTAAVGVNPLPNFTVSVAAICLGSSATLTASSGLTYSWQPGAMSGSTVIVAPTASTNYTVTAIDPNGCSNWAISPVTVMPLPVVTLASSSPSICIGGSVTLTGGGATSYITNPGAIPGSPITVSPLATTTYVVTGTDANGCVNSASFVQVVNPLPAVMVFGSPATVCTGSSATFTATGAASYSWNPGNLSGSSVIVSPTSTTTYTVVGTDANGCQKTLNPVEFVNPLPVITAMASPATVCEGGSTSLTANGGVVYAWSPLGGLNNPSISNPVATPTATTTYVATGMDPQGCVATASVTVTVNPLPPVSASSSQPAICIGGSVTLTGNGANVYSWMPGNLPGSPVTVSPTANTTYTVVGTDLNGCAASANVAVTVVSALALTGNTPTGFVGQNYGGSFTTTGGVAPYLDSISFGTFPTGLTLLSNGMPIGQPSATANFLFKITTTDNIGCSTSGTFVIQINNPAPGTLLSVNPGSVVALSPAPTLTLTVSGGVSSATVGKINGNSRPTVPLSPTQVAMTLTAADVASPNSFAISAFTPTPGGGITNNSLPFKVTAGPAPSTTSVTITQVTCKSEWPMDSAGVYFNCNSSVDSVTITFKYDTGSIIGPTPTIYLSKIAGPGNKTMLQTIHNLNPNQLYTFVIEYQTKSMANPSLSNAWTANCLPLGVDELAVLQDQLIIFPNPLSSGVAKVTLGSMSGIISLYDLTGREVGKALMTDGKAELKAESFGSGTYLVQLVSKDGIVHGKLVVVK